MIDGALRRHRHARPAHRRGALPRRPTPWCSRRAATATCSSCRPTPWPATSRRPGGPTGEARCFANPCYTQIHPTCIPQSDEFQSKLTLMSESLRNDGRIWVPADADDTRTARPDPGRRPRLLPRAAVPGVRQPRPARRGLARTPSAGRPGHGRRPAEERRVPRLRRCHRPPRRRRSSRALRQPLRDVRAHHRREPLQGADAHLPRAALHDGRALGRLRADDHRPRAVRASARPTSPTTAPTASARRR